MHALLSVSDKKGIVEFARGLIDLGFSILSTGGTAKTLSDAGIPVTLVETYTGFPEMMDGRLKTLHPKVHGGILGRPQDQAEMQNHDMVEIGLVVVNLYPFKKTILQPGCTFEKAIENIDIGGPTMLRAAAKNHTRVTVVSDPDDYADVLKQLREGGVGPVMRLILALKVFEHTADYDRDIAYYLAHAQGVES